VFPCGSERYRLIIVVVIMDIVAMVVMIISRCTSKGFSPILEMRIRHPSGIMSPIVVAMRRIVGAYSNTMTIGLAKITITEWTIILGMFGTIAKVTITPKDRNRWCS